MNWKEITDRAKSLSGYKYWYGGKGQTATPELARSLAAANPGTWTDSYLRKALRDCNGTNKVADCSYLVCYAYDIPQIGSWQIKEKFKKWMGKPKSGMILWRPGHVAIYDEGTVHQMKGIDYDYYDEPYVKNEWEAVLYDEAVDYEWAYSEGWHMDGGGWWYATGTHVGDYVRNDWKLINKRWFYFDENGYIKTGWFKVNGEWYWGDEDGIWHERADKIGVFEPWIVED